jgi:hypothetical protein
MNKKELTGKIASLAAEYDYTLRDIACPEESQYEYKVQFEQAIQRFRPTTLNRWPNAAFDLGEFDPFLSKPPSGVLLVRLPRLGVVALRVGDLFRHMFQQTRRNLAIQP